MHMVPKRGRCLTYEDVLTVASTRVLCRRHTVVTVREKCLKTNKTIILLEGKKHFLQVGCLQISV